MRRIVVFNSVSADGYFAGPDGGLDWVQVDEEMNRKSMESSGKFDTVLLGRRTYDLFAAFWPNALDESSGSGNPHDGRPMTEETRKMAMFLNDAQKLVFSRTLKEASWKNTRIIHDVDPKEISSMKMEEGADMILFGSGTIVTKLTEHRLIDEYQLIVNPVILGAGKKMISGELTNLRLELLGEDRYPSGNVMLRYGMARTE